ncbi:hypothetical protein P154DRAFT_524870 [Amniculicola lignicola CBS 123094]|uniref:Uncharacterized protein n=1 Tax=Amniculicola lignicola CBS 123094 TaxID=1392246 RepID=A0A6A5W948_9PLEO|nr:hypothetical protein P154DRAFT_524870 [Amniculicola lignicola CBS 123094]
MAEEQVAERCTSYGRGGAGNLRRPSTVVEARETLASLTDSVTSQRRRSSTWSLGSNHNERRGSIWKTVLRRGSSSEENEVEKIEE